MNDLHSLRAVISDMDGVLWRGDAPLPGVAEFFGGLRRRGIPFVLATNNATATFAEVSRRLSALGLPLSQQEVLTSARAAASFLRHQLPPGASVLAVGEAGLTSALSHAGFHLIGHAEQAAAVVAGLDRFVTWAKLTEAALAIRGGALFVATNMDPTFPSERGLVPGAGALIAVLETACGCHPIVIGKPEPHLFLEALEYLHAPPEATLVLGDRIETDIVGGQRAGMPTALLMTGVTTPQILAGSPIRPDWVFEDLHAAAAALLA
jgi:4-nitrophenyl phosphatase